MTFLSTFRARLLSLVLVALIVLTGTLAVQPAAQANENQPSPATVKNSVSGTLYPATALSSTGTVNTASPRTVSNRDLSYLPQFGAVDLFVTADFASTGTLTALVQFSNDATNWADCYRRIPETVATGPDSTISETCTVILTADGTGYISVPMAGQYMRLAMTRTASVTPTVQLFAKNTAGN